MLTTTSEIAIMKHKMLKNVKMFSKIILLTVLLFVFGVFGLGFVCVFWWFLGYEPTRLVSVFGCGGNRSKLRRYEMGEVSGRLADLTIITSDNPRFEKPQDIIEDIKTGIAKTNGAYVEICDRKEAIRYAIKNGQPGDVIVLAGKGHEDYQEIEGVKYPMDERVLIQEVLQELAQ